MVKQHDINFLIKMTSLHCSQQKSLWIYNWNGYCTSTSSYS